MRVGAVVLCGGTARRMGGVDKTALDIGDDSVLATLVAALPPEWAVVCVGEPRPLTRKVQWTREDPPLGGPVAGLTAGLSVLDIDLDVIVALAGDQPFAASAAVGCVEALSQREDLDGVAAAQPDGRPQLLLAAYRRRSLARALAPSDDDLPSRRSRNDESERLAAPSARHSEDTSASAEKTRRPRGIYATLSSLRIETVVARASATLDVDTPEDLERVRRLARSPRPDSGTD